jgi:hypothetical protein
MSTRVLYEAYGMCVVWTTLYVADQLRTYIYRYPILQSSSFSLTFPGVHVPLQSQSSVPFVVFHSCGIAILRSLDLLTKSLLLTWQAVSICLTSWSACLESAQRRIWWH